MDEIKQCHHVRVPHFLQRGRFTKAKEYACISVANSKCGEIVKSVIESSGEFRISAGTRAFERNTWSGSLVLGDSASTRAVARLGSSLSAARIS